MTKRFLAITLLTESVLIGLAGPVQAADAKVECGFFEYVAPDALTPGSIEFGASTDLGLNGDLYVIAAAAPVPPNLADLGGAPTCLELTLDSGVIMGLQYAPAGTVKGPVVVYGDPVSDPEHSVYVTAGRVATPASIVAAEPGLWAILGNSVATGEDANLVLQINTDFGFPQSFTASTRVHGEVQLSDADIGVGAGTLPEEVIDEHSRELLEKAAHLNVKATVVITSEGTIDLTNGALNITTELDVSFVRPAPSASPTQAPSAEPTRKPSHAPGNLPPTDAPASSTPQPSAPLSILALMFCGLLVAFAVRPAVRRRPPRCPT